MFTIPRLAMLMRYPELGMRKLLFCFLDRCELVMQPSCNSYVRSCAIAGGLE